MSASLTTNIPTLESGDRLTRHEFERRCQVTGQVKKAELIEGVVYVASPVRATRHSRPHPTKNCCIVWQIYENRLDWFSLEEGRYVLLPPDEKGVIRYRVFPGLWLGVNTLRAGNLASVLAILQQGVTDKRALGVCGGFEARTIAESGGKSGGMLKSKKWRMSRR